LLEDAGLAVCLVNPRHVKNVPGRKTGVQDCQWLQYLHSVGLLRAAFRAPAEVRPIRVLWRHRDALVRQSASQVQHIHKAFDQMNVQIHHVIADITGVTGTAIVEAIHAGQRDPAHLAGLRDKRLRADVPTLTRALTGDYRAEHLFCLPHRVQPDGRRRHPDCGPARCGDAFPLRLHRAHSVGVISGSSRGGSVCPAMCVFSTVDEPVTRIHVGIILSPGARYCGPGHRHEEARRSVAGGPLGWKLPWN
jgi:hypothetical protein